MKDWNQIFNELSDSDKDKIAVLRVMECANGVIQHAYRSNESCALSLEETRRAMKFSMSCMKNMTIPFKDQIITFEPETENLLREVRDLYISGFKQGDDEALEEFYALSKAHFKVLGRQMIDQKFEIITDHFEDLFTPYWIMMGRRYIYSVAEFVV